PGSRTACPADADPRAASQPRAPTDRVPVPPALPARLLPLHVPDPAAARDALAAVTPVGLLAAADPRYPGGGDRMSTQRTQRPAPAADFPRPEGGRGRGTSC